VNVDNEKMAKSLGNFFTIRDVLQRYDPETLRFFIARAHYRSPLNYSDAHLDDARASLKRLYTALQFVPPSQVAIDWREPHAARFKSAMDEDFGTPEAMAVLFELAGEVNRTHSTQAAVLLKSLGATLGLLQHSARAYLQSGSGLDETRIEELIAQRNAAKAARDFALADQIRKDLAAQSVLLQDSAQGTTWVKA
jgi:cysteinyl-tRNA synthetase